MRAEGLAATLCRTPAEWRATEQGRIVAGLPPVCVEESAAPVVSPRRTTLGLLKKSSKTPAEETSGRPPSRLLKRGVRPLSDVIVVDFSHVIASPMVGRTLAEHGATVFKIFADHRPRRKLFDEETNAAKIPLHVDLDEPADRAFLWQLVKVADVLVDGYTEGVLEQKLGFSEAALHAACPDLVYCRVTCYGHVGPWARFKGFQQNANFATGVATVDDEALLCYQLTSQVDYATGFLGAAGVVLALIDRQHAALEGRRLGGLLTVRTSLCQAATWMARFDAALPTRLDFVRRVTRLLFGLGGRPVTDGNIRYLPPAVDMAATPATRAPGFRRWWHDA